MATSSLGKWRGQKVAWIGFLAISVAVAACSKKKKKSSDDDDSSSSPTSVGGSGSSLAVTGKIGSGLHLAGAADLVVAVPMPKAGVRYYGFAESLKTASVAADGSFDVSFSGNESDPYVLLLVDSDATGLDSVVGAIGMDDPGSSLLRMPIDDATEDLSLGEVNEGDKGLVSERSIGDNASAVDLTESALKELAKTDDGLQFVKNAYANVHPDGSYYSSSPYLTFDGDIQDLAKGDFTAPTDVAYHGFGLYFNVKNDVATLSKVCGGSGNADFVRLEVTPPEPVTAKWTDGYVNGVPQEVSKALSTLNNTDTGAIEASADRNFCGSVPGSNDYGQIYASAGDSNSGEFGFNFGAGGFDGAMPSGVWKLAVNGAQVASFDMASAHPLSADGHPTVYVPSLKITTSGGVVSGAAVKFNLWNPETSAYEAVSDVTALEKSVGQLMFSMTDFGGCDGSANRKEVVKTFTTAVDGVYDIGDLTAQGMALPTSSTAYRTDACEADAITVSYVLNGATIHFGFRYDWQRGD